MVKLFVGNLVEDIDDSIIRSLFEEYGTVDECDVLGKFGFVHMSDENAANDAIKNLNGRFVEGRKMNVEISTSTVRGSGRGYGRGGERGGRGGRGRGGFRGGRGGSDWGGRGSFSGRGGRGRGGMDRYTPYPRSRGGMGGGDYYDSYQEQRLKVAAEALRQFDEAYGTDGYGGGSGFGGSSSGDPYARPPPEYYNDKGDFGRSGGGYGGYDKGRRGGFYQGY